MVYISKNDAEIPSSLGEGSSLLAKILNQVSPQTALYIGFGLSVMTICTIGFVVLLLFAIK